LSERISGSTIGIRTSRSGYRWRISGARPTLSLPKTSAVRSGKAKLQKSRSPSALKKNGSPRDGSLASKSAQRSQTTGSTRGQ